jgi:hypothetical protein
MGQQVIDIHRGRDGRLPQSQEIDDRSIEGKESPLNELQGCDGSKELGD